MRYRGEISVFRMLFLLLCAYAGLGYRTANASDFVPTLGNASAYTLTKTNSSSNGSIPFLIYDKEKGVFETINYTLEISKTNYGSGDIEKVYQHNVPLDQNVTFTVKYTNSDLKSHVTTNKNTPILDYSGTWADLSSPSPNGKYLLGGAFTNYGYKVGDISGMFVNNSVVNSKTDLAWGGAIVVRGVADNIYADFINNSAIAEKGEGAGGAIIVAVCNPNSIVGDFIGNYVLGTNSVGWGGAIFVVNSSDIKLLKGNFISNYAESVFAEAIGGAIETNWNGKITDLEGDFIGNYALGASFASGGAIHNGGRIDTITGDFIGNYVDSISYLAIGGAISNEPDGRTTFANSIGSIVGDFYNNYVKIKDGDGFGGALYNIAEIDEIEASFYGNYVISEEGEAKGGAVWTDSNLNFVIKDKDMVVANNYTISKGVKDDNAFWVDNNEAILNFNLSGSGDLVLADNFDGVTGYGVNIFGNNKNNVYLLNDIRKADVGFGNITLSTNDNKAHIYKFNSLKLSGDVDFVSEVDFEKEVMDRFETENGIIVENDAKLNVMNLNWINEPVKDKTSIMFAEKGLKDSVVYKGTSKIVTPLYVYDIAYNNNGDEGYFEFLRGSGSKGLSGFNPAVVGSGISTNAGATGVLSQTLNYSFQNLDNYMNIPMGERILLAYNLSSYETSMSAGEPLPSFMKENKPSVWVKPYVIDEDILLKNGAEISNKTYGTLVGYDTGVRKINASLDGAFTAYIGHSGATQEYDGVEAHQKGGLIGGTLSFYRGDFFSATTLSVGALETESKSIFGKEDYSTFLAGIGNKTGYNFEFNSGKFIIQPSLMLAYSYINTEDYKNVLGVNIKNDAIHSLQISPGVRFIFDLGNGWKPYFEASKVWDIGERGQTAVDGVKLPSMYVKPYEQYGLGIQGHINNQIMVYGQSMIEDGGRDGVLVTGGFRWLF